MTNWIHTGRWLTFGLCVMTMMAGCAGGGPSDRTSEFDPFGFPGDDSVVTAGVERTAIENRRVTPSAKLQGVGERAEQTKTVMFVQFFTTTNYMEAEDVRRRASEVLKEPVAVQC